MLLQSIQLSRFLSYGPDSAPLSLRPLNVLIGANASGKSNLLDAFAVLQKAPRDLNELFRLGGGLRHWFWKGEAKGNAVASINVQTAPLARGRRPLSYCLSFGSEHERLQLIEEHVELVPPAKSLKAGFSYHMTQGKAELGGPFGRLAALHLDLTRSVLAQRRDPEHHIDLYLLAEAFDSIRIYRDWYVGREAAVRRPQDAALRNDHLDEDGGNLALVLSRLANDPTAKARLVAALKLLYEDIDDYVVVVEGGTAQLFLHEGRRSMPATRLSDGTLRYLCLLAVLLNPTPPPLVCIDEPELGLHPDILPELATLLREASQRTQLVVTTHSDRLVDALTDEPESVVVVERDEGGSRLQRLDPVALAPWLAKYRLGTLWSRGDIGGNRW
jgi:predicted ATPase